MRQRRYVLMMATVAMAALVVAGACAKKKPPVARPGSPPPAAGATGSRPGPPEPVQESVPVPAEPIASDTLSATDIDTLNRNSPFQPVFYEYDQDTIDAAGQQALNANAGLMKKYPTWVVTIEGHSDERGTAEYNLALGERRALAARNYLVSLGVPADRLRTVSYGKEFPFEPGHDEASWSKNRRAHFVVTSRNRGLRAQGGRRSACGPSEGPACQPERRPAFATATAGNLRPKSARRLEGSAAERRPRARASGGGAREQVMGVPEGVRRSTRHGRSVRRCLCWSRGQLRRRRPTRRTSS